MRDGPRGKHVFLGCKLLRGRHVVFGGGRFDQCVVGCRVVFVRCIGGVFGRWRQFQQRCVVIQQRVILRGDVLQFGPGFRGVILRGGGVVLLVVVIITFIVVVLVFVFFVLIVILVVIGGFVLLGGGLGAPIGLVA